MSSLGFYVDIAGIKHLLATDEAKVMSLIYGLGNDLHKIGEYFSHKKIARLLAYQMGDGFMVQFDNVQQSGTPDDMVSLTVVLAQKFLIARDGILHIGLGSGEIAGLSEGGFTFANKANNNSGNGYHCGQGLFFLLPIMGTLLARAYSLTNQSVEPKAKEYQPRILIHSNLYSQMSETSSVKEIQTLGKKEGEKIYFKHIDPDPKSKSLYQGVWGESVTQEKISKSLKRYNQPAMGVQNN